MREPGRVFTRTELCERIWEHAHEYDTKLVEVFIGRLLKRVGDPPLRRLRQSVKLPSTYHSSEIALVSLCLDHVASFIENAKHSSVRLHPARYSGVG
jgi:hypothetical protein